MLINVGFQLGLIEKRELILYFENEYNCKKSDVSLDVISLSESCDVNRFIEILTKYSYEVDKNDFVKLNSVFLFFLLKETDWHRLEVTILRYYGFFNQYFDETDFEFWSNLRDDFELRRDGFSGCMNMPSDLLNYLNNQIQEKYTGTFIENLIIYCKN